MSGTKTFRQGEAVYYSERRKYNRLGEIEVWEARIIEVKQKCADINVKIHETKWVYKKDVPLSKLRKKADQTTPAMTGD